MRIARYLKSFVPLSCFLVVVINVAFGWRTVRAEQLCSSFLRVESFHSTFGWRVESFYFSFPHKHFVEHFAGSPRSCPPLATPLVAPAPSRRSTMLRQPAVSAIPRARPSHCCTPRPALPHHYATPRQLAAPAPPLHAPLACHTVHHTLRHASPAWHELRE
jgi:hypothetical protein